MDESDGCGAKFAVLVVSDKFVGMPLIDRQVCVYVCVFVCLYACVSVCLLSVCLCVGQLRGHASHS